MRELKGSMIICGRRNGEPKCYKCGMVAARFCDMPVDKWGNVCNHPCCDEHSEQMEGWNKHWCVDHIQIDGFDRTLAPATHFPLEDITFCVNMLIRHRCPADHIKVLLPKAIELAAQSGVELRYAVSHVGRAYAIELQNSRILGIPDERF